MKVEAVFDDVPHEMKRLIKKWAKYICEQVEDDDAYSNVASLDDTGFYYETASGKGRYNIDFSQRGKITVWFEGYRNSLKGGTPFFSLIPEFIKPHETKTTARFVIQGPIGNEHLIELFGRCKIETSKPEVPLLVPKSEE